MNPNSENAGVVPALRKHIETMRTEDKDSGHQSKEQDQSKKKSSTSGKNVCEYCDRRFNEYSNLIKHRRIHTGLKPYKCDFCNKAFTQSSNLNVHRKRCQLSCKKQTQCFANPAQRSNNTNLKKKLIRNNFQKSHDVLSLRPKENINALVFDTTQELVQNGNDFSSSEHLDISNSNICRELQYKSCWQKTSSNNNFKTKFAESSLKYGKLNVLGSQKGSVISAPARSLYQHPNKINSSFRNTQGIRLAGSSFQQTKRRAYFCEFCSRRFNESSNLIKHRRIHTGQRPYKCNFCGKDFTQSSNLNVHKKICKGHYFAKTAALHFVPSTKSATLSSSGVQNEFKKVSRYLSSRIGALEKSSLPSQLPHQNNLPICSWNDMKSSRGVLDTSSLNGPISQLQNTELPFSTTDNQILPPKYIFYSSQPQNINDEYAEYNTEEQCSSAQADLMNPLEIKLDVTQNSDDWIQLQEKCLDPGSNNLFRCQHCDETFPDSSFLQGHILQVHTGKPYFGPTSDSPTLTNQQACTNGKSYTCELCHKKFTRISILNFHRKKCAKNFSHNSHISLVDYEEDHNIKNLDFNSANSKELDNQTASAETSLSLDKCLSLINNPKNINYIVIDDDDDDDDEDEGSKPDNDLNTRETMKQENSVVLTEDLKPALVKEEPDDFPVSMETYSNLSLSEVDSKSFLSHVEPEAPTLEVWEIKQEPLENQDPSSTDALGVVKQEIFDENYDWNSIDIQPSMSGPEVMHNIFETGMAPILETRFRSEELETKNLDFITDNQHLLLDNYESDFIQEVQNDCSSNSFENISSKRHLNSQYFIRKSSNKLQCHFPSCNGRIFKSVSAFQVHVRVHNGQKPYMCEICNKTFNERSNFTKHLRIHSGSKPYKCTQCGRDFTQSSNLNVHKRKCRGLGSIKTPIGSVSDIMLEPKSSPTNRINFEGFSEVSHNSMNAIRSSANSSQSLAASVQSNVNSYIPEEYDSSSSVPKQTCIKEKNDYEESIESNSAVSEPSQNFGKGTLYTCEFCDKGFIESSDLIKHKTCHSVSKSYKCSFCHKVFTLLTNYNLHKATCKRKLSLNGTCHNEANPEMKNLEFLSDNSNSLLPTSSERSRKMPDTNVSLDLNNQIKSSSYFSQRNEFSILPTSAVLQGQQKNEQNLMKNFSHSSFDSNASEEKIVTVISDENSNRDFKSVNPSDEDLGLNQQQSVEEIRHDLFEVRTDTDSFENQTKIQTPFSDSSDQNSISIKNPNKPNSFQTKTAPKPILNPEKFFQCKLHYCRKIFHLATDLMEHAKQHKRRGVHVCKFCNKQFNESSNLVKHRRIHTGSKPYKCEFCNRFFTQSSNRNVHRKNCWKSTARNSASSGVFNSMKAQTEAKSNFVQCEICLQHFKHITDLESHKNFCKLNNRNRIENPALNKQINSNLSRKTKASKFQSGVKSSKNVENSNKELNCFQNTVSLGSLPQENTTNSLKTIPLQKNALHGRYMFQCPERECGKIFETTSMLRNHINDHKNAQQYPCEFCSKTFSSFENLSKHCETHTGYKSYRCSLCGKVFAQSTDYFNHCKTCNTSILPNPAQIGPQIKLTEKSPSASGSSIKGIVENSYYKAQLQQTETTNHVINIDDDDDDDDDDELVIIEPGESVLSSNISSEVDEHPGNKSGEMVSPNNLHLNDHLSNNQLIGIERVMLKNSPDNILDGDLSSNELGTESGPSKNLGQLSRKEDSSNSDEDLITSKDTSVSLIEISSQSGYKSNGVINSTLFCNRLKTDSTSSQLRINLPNNNDNNNNDNNNPKPQMETHFDNIRKLSKNLNSRSPNLFSCKVRLCQKVFKSEQELKAHQCKRRTYPCEYCQKRFNESSNLIKHRRIHTGHKPYRCKFCGKTFTQSSNLNVHNKICGKKHNFVECRFSQCLPDKRNIENTDAVCGKRRSRSGNGYYLKLNLNEDKAPSNAERQITETNKDNPGENLEPINGIKRVVSNEETISIRVPSVNPLFIENSSPITKLDDRTSVKQKTGQLQDSGIIVENSLTGEVELQLSEKELSAYKINETLPVNTRTDDDLREFRNSQDGYSVNLIPSILKKETYQLDPKDISIFPSNTGNSQTLDPLQLASNNFYNSQQPARPSSSHLDLVTNKATQIVHRFSRHKRTMKSGMQLKKLSLTHLKRASYTCEFCKRRFNESSNLIKHRRIHTGLRPYKCQLCGKTFTQSSNRNVHKKICAKKHQLSNSLVEGSDVSMSVNQQINWTNFQKNKTLKYQKTGYLQTSETQSYRKPDSALNIDQNQVKNLGSNDNQPISFVNDTEPICSISSVRSLRENPAGHFPFLDSETKYFVKNRTNDLNHSLIASDSRNSLPETTLCSNNQSLHSVGNVDRLSTDLSKSSNFDPVFQLVNYNKPIETTNETTPSNLNHNFNSISLCQDQNEFPRKYFQCFFCPRLCRNSADFQRHIRVHTGHKPYKCKICNKLFTDHSNFSKHCRVHTGYKPYKCNLCYRAFSQSSNLNVHKKNCKGFHLNSSLNLSFQSKTTNSLIKPRKLNSQVPQIVLPSSSEEVRNLTVPSSKAHSSTSKLIPGTTVSDLKSHPRLSMNKLAHSKSVAQRISLKYLNKITLRSNKTFFKNSETSSKPKILHQVLNEKTPVLQNTNSTSPETINITSSSNKLSSHLIKNNSYLKKKNYIGLLDKNHNSDHPKAIADRTSISNYKNQNKIHYQTKSKKYSDLHQIRKYYYCEYCNRRFNEASNLTKHRRIHTGLKPYKCQQCSKRFTQSSNLNVHKKICKAIVKNSEILINPDKGLWSKSSCMSESDSIPQVNSESQIFAEPTKDENPKQTVRSTEVKKFAGIEKISKEEEDQNNSVSLSLEMSNITNASEISINYPSSIYKNTNIGNEIEDSTPDQAESHPKPNNENKLSECSLDGVSNFKSISSPKHIKNDLVQEKSIQLKLLEDSNYNYIIKDKCQLSPDNPSRVKKTRHDLNLKSDNTNKNCLLVDIESINKRLDHQNTDSQKESFLINSSSDQNNTNDNDLDVQLATEFDSSNKDDNNMIRQPSQIPLSFHNYNSQKSETDSKTNQSNISQSLINYNENLDKSIKSNDLSNLLVVTEEKNREHSNSYAIDVLDSGTSNAQLKLSQSQNQVQVLLTDELKFENEPDLKNDVFSSEIELEHLHPQQSDILKNIQSAINGILQTENISSSVDQLDESLLQNAASDWFKVDPCYPKNELVVLNNIDPSSKNADSKSQEVNSCGSNEEEEDDIIIDSSINVQPMKSKLRFEEETIPQENKSSYQTISEENPLSDFDCSITVQSKSVDRLSESHNNGNTAVSPLTNSYSKTKHILDFQNNGLSEKNYEISDQPPLKHNNQTEFLQVNCSKQQLNSNNFIDEDDVDDEDDDDDVAIIDIKSTLPLGAQSNLNITSTELPYDPAYFSNNIKVSSTVCKSNMEVFLEDPITKQTDNRLDHIRESFDYLVPNITDQLDSENDCKVVEASKTDNASPPSRDGVYVCEFCQERFLDSSLLVGHHCPNTGDKPYLCPDCGKAFSLYANVIAHKSTCLKLSVKMADFSALNKNDSRLMNNYEMETQTSSINQLPWGGEYHFSSEVHSKTLPSGNSDNTGVGQNSEPLSSGSSKEIQNGYEAKTNVQRSKYENSLNQLSEFPSSNLEITLDNYDCQSRDNYNDFNSSVPCNSQAAPSDKSELFLGDSFANNHNTVTEIRNTLPSAESLPSDNINSSLPLSSSISVSLDKLSSTRPPPDNLNFQIHPNKHSLFPGSELSYMHNNYRPQSCVSSNLYPNVLLKDLTATDLSSNQTSEYSLRSPTAFLSSTVHSNTSIPTSISSASSTSFNNVLDPAVSVRSVSCQYCDKVFSLSELDSHKCSGVAQANRYACTFCEKTLCDASSLSKHLRIHTGHKPYSCEFCGKAFTQSSNLNVHKRVCKDRDNQHGTYLNSSI